MIRPFEFVAPFDLRVLPDTYISPAFRCALDETASTSQQSGSGSGGGSADQTVADYLQAAYAFLKSQELPRTTRAGFSMTMDPYPFGGMFPSISGTVTGIPAGQESNFEIRSYRGLTLDPAGETLDGTTTPNPDGTWISPAVQGGYRAALYDLVTGEFVTEAFLSSHLLRAYSIGGVLQTDPMWDRKTRTARIREQSFAAIAATSLGDFGPAADWAFGAWTTLSSGLGRVNSEVSYFGGLFDENDERTDTQAWMSYALSFLTERFQGHPQNASLEFGASFSIISLWIDYFISAVGDPRRGMVKGGNGIWPAPAYVFAPFAVQDSFITRNAAAFFAFKKFSEAFPLHFFASTALDAANRIAATVKTTWDSILLRSPHSVDEFLANDLRHSIEDLCWYALLARATGHVSKELDTLAMLENYRVAGGYTSHLATYGYPEFADGQVSVQGTAQAALALWACGQEAAADSVLNELRLIWQDVGFTNRFLDDPTRGEQNESAVMGAAMSILAGRPNGFIDL